MNDIIYQTSMSFNKNFFLFSTLVWLFNKKVFLFSSFVWLFNRNFFLFSTSVWLFCLHYVFFVFITNVLVFVQFHFILLRNCNVIHFRFQDDVIKSWFYNLGFFKISFHSKFLWCNKTKPLTSNFIQIYIHTPIKEWFLKCICITHSVILDVPDCSQRCFSCYVCISIYVLIFKY